MEANQVKSGQAIMQPVKIGIILLTLATVAVHLIVLNIRGVDILFALNGLGFIMPLFFRGCLCLSTPSNDITVAQTRATLGFHYQGRMQEKA